MKSNAKAGLRIRLIGLGLGAALMGALIIAATLDSQKQATEARARLSEVDVESFRIADNFRDRLRHANDKLRRYGTTEEKSDWEEFLKGHDEVTTWIAREGPLLSTEREKHILTQMAAAAELYRQRAFELHDGMKLDPQRGASVGQFNGFFEQARHLLDLGDELGRAHFESRSMIVGHATRALTELRLLVLGLVVLLFAFGLALALSVYRDLIAPLRTRLLESQAVAERHEKLASLGLLAAGIAHEIRNPLTAIKTALFLQQKRTRLGSPEHGDTELIEREIVRLEGIVNEFLAFARPNEPKVVAFAAADCLQEVHQLLSPQLAQSDIRLVLENSHALQIRADPAQIKQVLINLVQNAADSIGKGGTIWLRSRPDHRRLANGETDAVLLEVSDTGKGIPPEVQKRLLDPFFTTKDTGTGLGLCIAARIVQMNGGALQYQTQLEHGSTFGIVLPQADAPLKPNTPLEKQSILVHS